MVLEFIDVWNPELWEDLAKGHGSVLEGLESGLVDGRVKLTRVTSASGEFDPFIYTFRRVLSVSARGGNSVTMGSVVLPRDLTVSWLMPPHQRQDEWALSFPDEVLYPRGGS